ncbi:MAG TPA: glycosyltransferase family 2 protein [Gemmatimonadales bacterium]|nr:glycosyltransferase family 2 protein [Gemmatimonadales bacterium]
MSFPPAVELLPAAPWLLPFLTLPRLATRTPNLSDAPRESGKLLSVIIPARNEADTIAVVVRSILKSTYEPFELIVVDDRSTDGTASIVQGFSSDQRVRLIRGEELPEGWYGKPWACLQGYCQARGELLLFTDADTRHEPELLERAVGALHAERADLVTVSPTQRCVTFWERVIMPQIWFLLALRYSPAQVNRATRARDVIANGQFIMTTRAAYEAAGTHVSVRHEVAEDLALAQTYLQKGLRLHFAFAERLMETRMYRDLASLIEGWSKNIYLGGRRSFPQEPLRRALVPAMLAIAMLFWLLPPVMLLAAALLPGLAHLQVPAFAAFLLGAAFWMLIGWGMKIPAVYGLGYPLGALMTLYISARSTRRGARRVEWRGRVYKKKA